MNIANNNSESLLTAIIPIGRTGGNLDLLYSWLPEASNFSLRIIMVHDVLDHETGPLLKKLFEEFKELNLTLIEGLYGNPGQARNAGLELASTHWIAFWDHDDKPVLNSIFKSINESRIEDEILIGEFGVRNIMKDSSVDLLTVKTSFNSISMNPGIWRMVFKNDLIHDKKFTNLRMGEDQMFLSDIKLPDRAVRFIPEIFYEYSIGSANQLTNNKSALVDLPLAAKYIYKHTTRNSSKALKSFNMNLIFRQQSTLINNGDMSLRIESFWFLSKTLLSPKPDLFWCSVKSLFIVLVNLKKFRLK
jgi:glycosyltransferase involved in cell wall biosynthesis